MMLTIGERINATRKNVSAAIRARDADAVREEAWRQYDAGALMLDINGGTTPETESEAAVWLMEITAAATSAPLCADSANPEVIEAMIRTCLRVRGAHAPGSWETAPGVPWLLINSISAERERYDSILPLVKKYNTAVVALCLDENMPDSARERVAVGASLIERLAEDGVPPERVYADPLVLPVGVDARQGLAAIQTVTLLKQRFPTLRTVCGLSNVSFGLPARGLLNRAFLTLLVGAGLDAAIVDPTDKKLMAALNAALALCNRDPYCADYITAFRAGRLDV